MYVCMYACMYMYRSTDVYLYYFAFISLDAYSDTNTYSHIFTQTYISITYAQNDNAYLLVYINNIRTERHRAPSPQGLHIPIPTHIHTYSHIRI